MLQCRTSYEYCIQLLGGCSLLYQGIYGWTDKSSLCIYRFLWIYSLGYGILFHALSVYLQGLSENFPVFLAWYDFRISYGMDTGKGMSQKCYLQYASFSELWFFPYRKS